ncbi:helix-turn-helix domain-containing protein [Alicyclobacillus dauci]|uniref:Helix-turn-helix domain-containing protein n=1 Tax=Alicyclobacillus dauci TaxID=1475485 RepID=A0ABY6YWT2_9BACL|nr:helix-turn-helix transcriptional regulator [Alicyclobacillus dauci]WAH34999.1 helix-turn-helix domain-containing protein [Alicyclobacillus dauci]
MAHINNEEKGMTRPITMERIREERKKLKMTQEELGKLLGKNKSFISRLERYGQHLSVPILDQLADIFECTTDYLLGRTDKRN